MENITDFISEHYLLFILLTLFLIFALVGYFVDLKRQKASPFKIASRTFQTEKVDMSNMQVSSSVGLSQYVQDNKTINNNNQL